MKAAAAALLLIVFPATGLMFRQNLTPSTLQGALAEVDGPQTYYEDDERGDGHSKPGQVLSAPGWLDEHTAGLLSLCHREVPI